MKSRASKLPFICPRGQGFSAPVAPPGGGGGGGGGGGVTPLPAMTIIDVEAAGYDYSTNPTQTITGSNGGPNAGDGIVRAQTFSNILSTGMRGHLKRGRVNDTMVFNGRHYEFSWSGQPEVGLNEDWWYSFAHRPLSGEWFGDNNAFSDQQVIFQLHQQNAAGDGPCFALNCNGGDNSLRCEGNYDLGLGGGGNNSYTIFNCGQDTNLLVDTWNVFVLHVRMAITVGNGPRVELWRRNGNGAFNKIVDRSGSQCYMGYTGDENYVKIGLYKWASTTQDNDRRGLYHSDVFHGTGTNLYNEAVKAVELFV